MKINIISFNNHHSLSNDCELISHSLKKFYPKKKIYYEFHNFQEVTANVADINIFIGLVSHVFFKYAPQNILIMDPHKFDPTWIPYLSKLDHIICKSKFGFDLLPSEFQNKKKLLGWKTADCYENQEKDYSSVLCVLGYSIYRQIGTILELWKDSYPKLVILCGKNYFSNHKLVKKEQDNIEYREEYLPSQEYHKLLNHHGIHLCLSSASSYSNTLQQGISTKSIVIGMENVLNKEFIIPEVSGFLVKCKKKKKLKHGFGSEYLIDRSSFTQQIEKIIKLDSIQLEEMAEKAKSDYRLRHKHFDIQFKEFFDQLWKNYQQHPPLQSNYQKFDEDFPPVTLITPTYNRRKFFPLAIRNYQKTDYPKDKLEWIIIDDSDQDNIEDLIPQESNIKYHKLESKHTVGYKRNLAVQQAQHDIIVCFDDDDYYQPGHIKYRVACLEHLQKEVVGCTSLGMLDINKIISNLSVSSFLLPYYERVFESTLAFTKKHAMENPFEDTNCLESKPLIQNHLGHFEEINYQPIIVSLNHYGNTNRRIPIRGETNGSHFNFSDELFNFITNLEVSEEDKLHLNKVISKKKDTDKV